MKRSFFIRIIAFAASLALLTGALVVAAVTGSPYEILKKSLLNVGELNSHSFNASMKATLNGVAMESEDQYFEYVDGRYSMSRSGDYLSYSTPSGSLNLYSGETRGSFYTSGTNQYFYNPFNSFSLADEDPRYVRLFEMAADLLVGDLKNNISMTQTGDIRHISGTLTANQIPELYALAFELLMTEGTSNYHGISFGYDMSTLDTVNMTIDQTDIYISGRTLYERVSECMLQPFDGGEFYDEQILMEIRNGNTDYGIFYIDGEYYNTWSTMATISKETPLDEATYRKYARPDELPPVESATISYVHGEADIDADGFLRGVSANASISIVDIFGYSHELEIACFVEIEPISSTGVARYEKLMNTIVSYLPDSENYYNVSFTLDAGGNPVIESIYDGWSSRYEDLPVETEAYPADEMDEWIAKRVDEMLADPIYTGVDRAVLETIALNEWMGMNGEAA